jgi:hypothetical protein
MVDYGNTRIAVLRSRLLDPFALRRLSELDSLEAALALLERSEDWRAPLREATPLYGDPLAAIETSIERHRGARLGALAGWYEGSTRRLVEALVMRLDIERVVAVVRRRHGGLPPSEIGATLVRGALLDVTTLGAIARADGAPEVGRVLARAGLVSASASRTIGAGGLSDLRGLEVRLVHAFDDARNARAAIRGGAARQVRDLLVEERAERDAVVAELRDAGPSAAWLVERSAALARLDRLARMGPRDPLGIGAVAGYVAAVEAQAIRMRAALARIASGWGREAFAAFLPGARD